MEQVKGFIEFVKEGGKSFKMDDGKWYSVFNSSSLKAAKGDYVEFNFQQNGTFNNVKGSVNKATAPASAKPSGAGVINNGGGKGFVAKEFPVPPLHPDRSIIRQNSMGHAMKVLEISEVFDGMNPDDVVEEAIRIARQIEAYSTGDLDIEAAGEAVKMALAKEY